MALRVLCVYAIVSCAVVLSPSQAVFGESTNFRRGDANSDSRVDLGDPVFILSFLFLGGAAPGCLDTADGNDDGALDLSDPLAILGFLFLGGPALPFPGVGACGTDPTSDDRLGCAAYPHCPQDQTRVVTAVRIEPDFLAVPLGGAGSLKATALDGDGLPIEGAPIRFVPSSRLLLVSASGEVSGDQIGSYSVVAVSGTAVSEAARVLIFHPREEEVEALSGTVERPRAGGALSSLRVLSPSGAAPVGADASFIVERLRFRNQILSVVDDTTGKTVWLGIAPGATADRPPEPVQLGPGSTAEALLYFLPGVAHPDPAVFAEFRSTMKHHPGLLEIESTIEASGSDWPSRIPEIARLLDAILLDVREMIERALAAPAGGAGGGGGAPEDFQPTSHPESIGGIEVTPVVTGERIADLHIKNKLIRQVDIYLEKVLPDGSRPPASQEQGPYQMGSSTGILPSIWQVLNSLGDGDFPILDAEELTIPGVNFDPKGGGSRQWRVFAYGIGVQSRAHRILGDRDRLSDRLLPAVVRSAIIDVLVNVISIAVSLPGQEIEKTLKSITLTLRAAFVGSAAYQGYLDAVAKDAAVAEQVVALLEFATDAIVDLLESDLLKEALADAAKGSAKALLKEAIEAATVVLEVWSAVSAVTELLGFTYSITQASSVEIIRIDDGPARLVPGGGILPKGFVDCPYEVELRVEGGEGPFTWTMEGSGRNFASLRLEPSGPPEFRRAVLKSDGFPEKGGVDIWVTVEAPLDVRFPEMRAPVAWGGYAILIEDPAPNIIDVSFPVGFNVDPGATLPLQVDVSHCLDAASIAGGQVNGVGLKRIALLRPPGSFRLTANLEVRKPLQDRPFDPDVETLHIAVTDVNGGVGFAKRGINVRNVAPSRADGSVHHVKPGESFGVTVDVQDDNEDGTRQEVFAADVKTSHPAGFKSTPKLDKLKFVRTSVDGTAGEIKFDSKDQVKVALPHKDNDGTTADPGDDDLFLADVQVVDDDRFAARVPAPVEIVVRNVAPVVDALVATPAVLPSRESVAVRPLDIRVHVVDDNGSGDIESVELDLRSLGIPLPIPLTIPTGLDADGRGATFEFHLPNVESDCKGGCPIFARAFDLDDEESNGGVSAQRMTTVLELNLPPVIGGDGILEYVGPTGGGRCPGDPMLFAVFATDPNRNRLAADLILDGVRIPLAPSSKSANIWKTIIGAPGPGKHKYFFEVREIDVISGALVTSTPVLEFEVDDCTPSGKPPLCTPETTEEEVCDGVDNNCNGQVDEGFAAPCVKLHSGQFAGGAAAVCPGAPLVFRVAVQGEGHPFPVEVELRGPEPARYALDAQTGPGGAPTGVYEAQAPAPGTPGDYSVTFEIELRGSPLDLPNTLQVSICKPPPYSLIQIPEVEITAFSFGTCRVAAGTFSFKDDVEKAELYAIELCLPDPPRQVGPAGAQGSILHTAVSPDDRRIALALLGFDPEPGTALGGLLVLEAVSGGPGGGSAPVRVDVSSAGEVGNGFSVSPSISNAPYRVLFESGATNLIPDDTNDASDVFLRDLDAGTTRRVSVATGGGQADGASFAPSLSADGGFAVFLSRAENLVDGDTNRLQDVFVHDLNAGVTRRVNVASNGAQANRNTFAAGVSGDGRLAVFPSQATNLVEGDTNNQMDVFVHDLATAMTRRVSVSTEGAQANGGSYDAVISADGRFAVFVSVASNLVPGDTNNAPDVFVHELATGRTVRILRPDGSEPAGFPHDVRLSADGARLLFVTSDRLVPEDADEFQDLYVVPNPLDQR